MITKIVIPQVAMGITEATISRWLKAEGDPVNEGEVIAEIETAKAIEEVSSPVSGVLRSILLQEGQTAEVLSEIAAIDGPDNAE